MAGKLMVITGATADWAARLWTIQSPPQDASTQIQTSSETARVAARIIDGKRIAEQVRARVATEVALFVRETGIIPHLAAVLVGDDPASAV